MGAIPPGGSATPAGLAALVVSCQPLRSCRQEKPTRAKAARVGHPPSSLAHLSCWMESWKVLLGRPLVLVAHPDDEALGCGALLQRAQSPAVIFATDGAPAVERFWAAYGSRHAYAEVRRQEAKLASRAAGNTKIFFLSDVAGN